MKTKILVTGSAGFIFSNFVRHVLKNYADYQIISIDKFNNKSSLNAIYRNKSHIVHIGDVADSRFVDLIFALEQPDYVIHGAAESSVSPEGANNLVRSNVQGTQSIIDACVKYKVKKLVYVSTSQVYGGSDVDIIYDESSSVSPKNVYSATKLSGEMLVAAASEEHGLNYNITRSCDCYGPKQPVTSFIPKIISKVIKNEKVLIHDDEMQIRDWIHVQDNCSAILKVLEDGYSSEIYNISSKQEFTNIEVFQEICNVLGRGYDLSEFIKDKDKHILSCSISNEKIKLLGWETSFKFKNGIAHTVGWYVNNSYFIKG